MRRPPLLFALSEEGSLLWAVLREPPFLIVTLLLLLLYSLVLQWPFAAELDVGAGLEPGRMNSYDHLLGRTQDERVGRPLDQAFLEGVHVEEKGAGYTFRWTEPEARLDIAGLANAPLLLRLRMHGAPAGLSTVARLEVDGMVLAEFPVSYPLHEYAFVVDPAVWSGDTLHVDLRSTPFEPGGEDTRLLGVALDRLTWIGWRAGWLPSLPRTALFLTGVAVFIYLGLRRAGLKALWAGTGTLFWGLAPLAGLLVPETRPFVALYSRGLLGVAAISYPVLVLTLHAAGNLLWRARHPPNQRDWRWLGVLFLLSFLLRFGGAMSPRYAGHDAEFHVHRVEFIQKGDIFFEHVSLEGGLRSDPYPGALYLLLAPFTVLVQDGEGLLSLCLAWLGSSEVFLIWFLARQVASPQASRWAALLYLAFPIGLSAYWVSIYANLFAIWVSLFVIVAVLLVLQGRLSVSLLGWVSLFALVFLAHFGNMILWCPLSLLWGTVLYVQGGAYQRVLLRRLAVAWLLAFVLSVAVYYSHFLPFFRSLFEGIGSSLNGTLPSGAEASVEGFQRILAELRVWWRWGVVADYAAVGLPLGGAGLLASCRARRRTVVSLLFVVVSIALFFWALSMVTFFFMRYMLFLLPVAAVGSAQILSLWWRKGPVGRVAAAILLFYICALTLWMWVGLCLFGLRPVHVL